MPEFKIRYVPEEVKLKIQELADNSYYPSMNAYLLDALQRIADNDGLSELEIEIIQQQQEIAKQIEENTKVLSKVIDLLIQ